MWLIFSVSNEPQIDRTMRLVLPYLLTTLAMVVVAFAGMQATDIGEWYRNLNKPSWQPPDWAFGAAWTTIYICIIAAVGMAWNVAEVGEKQRLLLVLGVNLGLNILWSYLFFAWRRPDWALIEVVFLWISIVVLMIVLYGIRPASGLLMLPYFAWVSVASYLTLTIVRINPAFGSS